MTLRVNVKWSRAAAWATVAIVAAVAAAYTPALGNGSTWSLPYSGSQSSYSPTISVTNGGNGYALSANASGIAIDANSTGAWGYGVYAIGAYTGLLGYQNGSTGTGYGVQGTGYIGVVGSSNASNSYGVWGLVSNGGYGVLGEGSQGAEGVFGFAEDNGWGVSGQSVSNAGVSGYGAIGVLGAANGSGENNAGHFNGNVLITGNLQVNGTINKSAVGFKIDHPLDPQHMYLMHSCVESDEMVNMYRGNVVLDSDGKAAVIMPEWFQAENRDFSYQLTCVGENAPVYVASEIEKNQFTIAGGDPGMKVCWLVTAVRNDKYANSHPLTTEIEKPAAERGKYIQPTLFGKSRTRMVGYMPQPGMPKLHARPSLSSKQDAVPIK